MKNWKKVAKKFIVAQSISLFGSSIVQYGIIWYLTLETGSAKILTLTTLCGFLPQMLISFFSGTLCKMIKRKSRIASYGQKSRKFPKNHLLLYCDTFPFFGGRVLGYGSWRGEEAGTGFYGPGKGRHTRGTTGND